MNRSFLHQSFSLSLICKRLKSLRKFLLFIHHRALINVLKTVLILFFLFLCYQKRKSTDIVTLMLMPSFLSLEKNIAKNRIERKNKTLPSFPPSKSFFPFFNFCLNAFRQHECEFRFVFTKHTAFIFPIIRLAKHKQFKIQNDRRKRKIGK